MVTFTDNPKFIKLGRVSQPKERLSANAERVVRVLNINRCFYLAGCEHEIRNICYCIKGYSFSQFIHFLSITYILYHKFLIKSMAARIATIKRFRVTIRARLAGNQGVEPQSEILEIPILAVELIPYKLNQVVPKIGMTLIFSFLLIHLVRAPNASI